MNNKKEQSNELHPVLGTINEFHTKSCYKLYLYAVELAKQANDYIDKGWLVLDDGQPLKKFVFYSMGSPCVAEKDGNCTMVWFGSCYDDEGKVWLHGDYTKKRIRERFKKIQIFDPANAVKLNCA